ncbi:energy-coupling factor transporter ATPase [Pelorhabdus rhamnosifermentans]|uniref:energy-coupling factor transporter ATPase n=1 Tax=Pelorhabdus rhamnosifermentans TaxID=2772457 RepID=UPI001C063BC4|nr:energy-coupling factor transporter ATPase [Pelorhabdus rhamnosifermentans]
MGEFIEMKHVSHVYQDHNQQNVQALDDVNLSIRAGTFVAVIGTNGSGKSTLAKHLNGLLLPTTGECLIDGVSTAESAEIWNIRQKVGMVFQNPDNQIVAAIVEEDVAFGPENLGIPSTEIRQRVDEALAKVDMTNYALHAPHLLSGGQKQRIAIAGVLAIRPNCIVLDEPTAMLDPIGRQEVMKTVKKLHEEQQITCVYITHFMEEAMQAERVIVMKQGKIVLDGNPHEVFSQVDLLKDMGLDVPIAAQVAEKLRQMNYSIPSQVISGSELAEALCLSN